MTRIFGRTKDDCHAVALKYSEVSVFRRENQAVYSRASRNGWIKEITSHMIRPRKGSATKNECRAAALKYQSKTEFERYDGFLYRNAKKNKWLTEICQHMISHRVDGRTKEDCKLIALKFSSRTELFTNKRSVYYIAKRHGWLDDICAHMTPLNVRSNVLYMWNVKGTNVWKIGVSNESQVDSRISKVASRNGVTVDRKFLIVRDDARQCENELLEMMKQIPEMPKKDGHSEFRILNDEEVEYAKNFFVESAQNEK